MEIQVQRLDIFVFPNVGQWQRGFQRSVRRFVRVRIGVGGEGSLEHWSFVSSKNEFSVWYVPDDWMTNAMSVIAVFAVRSPVITGQNAQRLIAICRGCLRIV